MIDKLLFIDNELSYIINVTVIYYTFETNIYNFKRLKFL